MQCHWDAGYFAAELAEHCTRTGIDFAIGAKRNTAVMRAAPTATAGAAAWFPATDPRARKHRTLDTDQLALALDGKIDHVDGYSFLLTNLDCSTPQRVAAVEYWYRYRTDIESLNKDAKQVAALRHMPAGNRTVDLVWMWAALPACAISNWLQELCGLETDRAGGTHSAHRPCRCGVGIG